jgi:hypothetical protein
VVGCGGRGFGRVGRRQRKQVEEEGDSVEDLQTESAKRREEETVSCCAKKREASLPPLRYY